MAKRSIRRGAIVALAAVMSVVPAARAEPLAQDQVAKIAAKAYGRWKASVHAGGLVGLQSEITRCFADVKAKPSQARAAYCIALDHYSLLDAMNFPADLVPPYFRTDPVFARFDAAVAQTTPPKDRHEFGRRLLVEADEAIHRGR